LRNRYRVTIFCGIPLQFVDGMSVADFDGLIHELNEIMSTDGGRITRMKSRHLNAIRRLKEL